MFPKLFLLFTIIPILELYTMVKVGSAIGVASTILIVLLTGVIGAWLARMEGFNTMMKVRESLNQGKMPGDELVEGVLILVAGILLLTPGFITDAMGIVLLFPPTRKLLARWLRQQLAASVRAQGSAQQAGSSAGFTYYTWHSSGQHSESQYSKNISRSVSSTVTGRGGHESAEDISSPRKAVVIDCEPVDDEKNAGR